MNNSRNEETPATPTAAPTITVGQPFFIAGVTDQERQETGPSAKKEETACWKKRRNALALLPEHFPLLLVTFGFPDSSVKERGNIGSLARRYTRQQHRRNEP